MSSAVQLEILSEDLKKLEKEKEKWLQRIR
jgi:hypothetical protein